MKILCAFLKYDYGIKARGDSIEKKYFYPSLLEISKDVIPFWLEENGFNEDRDLLQKRLISVCDNEKPDIIFFVLMKDEIRIDTIKKLSEKYVTINWFCDDHWRFETFTKFLAPFFSYNITNDKYSLLKYYRIGVKNVKVSQWGTIFYNENLDIENIHYLYDISFIGSKNIVREWFIKNLFKRGINVKCFGSGWNNERVSYDKMNEIFLKSKINLNLSNSIPDDYHFIFYSPKTFLSFLRSKKRTEQIKSRNFEISAAGGFQISNYAPGIEDYYIIGKEIIIFYGLKDLEKKIKYFLENEESRKEILKKGFLKSKNYTYKNIFQNLFQEILNDVKEKNI